MLPSPVSVNLPAARFSTPTRVSASSPGVTGQVLKIA
jgi:hypothetical protein